MVWGLGSIGFRGGSGLWGALEMALGFRSGMGKHLPRDLGEGGRGVSTSASCIQMLPTRARGTRHALSKPQQTLGP